MIEVSIIIANFNNPNLIDTCIKSVDKYFFDSTIEIVIVDNGSTDQNLDNIKSGRGNVVVKYLPKNMGFGYAINRGVEISQGRILLILNSDTELIDLSLQSMLSEFTLSSDHKLWSPQLVARDGTPQISALENLGPWSFFWRFSILGDILNIFNSENAVNGDRLSNHEIYVDYVYGTCLLIERKDFIHLGGFDERYFMYFEDLDFCDRFRRVYGKRVLLKSDARIFHLVRGSSTKISSVNLEFQKSKIVYAKRRFGLTYALVMTAFDSPFRLVLLFSIWMKNVKTKRKS